jgi:hypothetical protein
MPDRLPILRNDLLVRPIRIFQKLLHSLAGTIFGTLITKFKAFAACAGLEVADRAISGRLLTFASITLFGSFPALVFNMFGQVPQ